MKKLLIILTLSILTPVVFAEDVDARLDWSQRITMSTLVSGVVEKVNVVVGQYVKQGEVLLTLDQRVFDANLRKAEQELQSAELDKLEGDKEWERAQELYDRTVLSDHELATAKTLQAKSAANHEVAKAAFAQAKLEHEYSVLAAPFDGVVVAVSAQVGQTIINELQGQSMIVMANNNPMLAETSVSAKQARSINKNTALQVKVAGKNYAARLHSIGVEPVDGKYPLHVAFDPKNELLRKGERAEIVLP